MRTNQTSFLPKLDPSRTAYGGGKEKGKRKAARPFSQKLPMHIVFRASQAKGEKSLLTSKNKRLVQNALEHYAKLYRIKIYRSINVGNHIHLLLQTQNKTYTLARTDLANFLRRFSGEIAMKVSGARKGAPLPQSRFWDELVYSRLVSFGREFERVSTYFIKNLFEAHGLWDRKKFPEWELVTIGNNST
jgi:REP element-mobilizing transposase RayT